MASGRVRYGHPATGIVLPETPTDGFFDVVISYTVSAAAANWDM
ncbi:hypothetical protein B0G38_002836 [Arthrobacter sp. VKM Ac-2550]|nr:hypothetical protein [Arthrobacter sp. VKM Ac-2550]